jgi:hypothetical protein
VPGAYYTETNRACFDGIASILGAARLNARDAAHAIVVLDCAGADPEKARAELVRVPGLSRLSSFVPENEHDFICFAGLVTALLSAQLEAAPRAGADVEARL